MTTNNTPIIVFLIILLAIAGVQAYHVFTKDTALGRDHLAYPTDNPYACAQDAWQNNKY